MILSSSFSSGLSAGVWLPDSSSWLPDVGGEGSDDTNGLDDTTGSTCNKRKIQGKGQHVRFISKDQKQISEVFDQAQKNSVTI